MGAGNQTLSLLSAATRLLFVVYVDVLTKCLSVDLHYKGGRVTINGWASATWPGLDAIIVLFSGLANINWLNINFNL